MADISKIKLPNGNEYDIKDANISVTQKTSTGTNIADITIHGTTTSLYAPSGGGGGGDGTLVRLVRW